MAASTIQRTARALSESTWPLVRSALFLLGAETAHHVTMRALRWAAKAGGTKLLAGPAEAGRLTLWGLPFPNRVGLAAGLDKTGQCVDGLVALGFGFIETGTFTPRPQPGNPKPRLFRLVEKEAIINRMGFNNPGIEAGVRNVTRRKSPGVIGINIGKNFDTPNERATNDYLICLRAAWEHAGYIVVNLSSPNTKGLRDLQQEEVCRSLLRALHAEQKRLADKHGRHVPVLIKIAPDLEPAHLDGLARVFIDEGLEGVIATNTTVARPQLDGVRHASEAGGLSGAPLTRLSTEVVARLCRTLDGALPVIASGGIMSAADAVEKLQAGAVMVQLYTGLIYHGPRLVRECADACGRFFQP